MTIHYSDNLNACTDLIRKAAISDETRVFLTNQAMIYALFLSDLDAGKVSKAHTNTVESMLEIIGEFCAQVTGLLTESQAA